MKITQQLFNSRISNSIDAVEYPREKRLPLNTNLKNGKVIKIIITPIFKLIINL